MFRIIKKGLTKKGDEYIGDHSIYNGFVPKRWTKIKHGGLNISKFMTLIFRRKAHKQGDA